MLEFLFTLWKLAVRAVTPLQQKSPTLDPALEDELLLLKHIQTDV